MAAASVMAGAYPLIGISLARLGHPSRLKIDTLARPFSEEVFAIDIFTDIGGEQIHIPVGGAET